MLRTVAFRSTLIAFACTLPLAAYAMADDLKHIDVPRGDLTAALESLAKQSGIEIVYRSDQLKGLHTSGVRGDISPQDAVKKLLEGTPLVLRTDSTGAMLIATPLPENAPRSGPQAMDKQTTQDVRVKPTAGVVDTKGFWNHVHLAQADQGTSPAASGATAGREAAPNDGPSVGLEELVVTAQKRTERLQDVPSSISVMTSAQLERVQPNSLVDFASYVPGFNVNSNGSPGQTQITLRGISTGASLGGTLVGTYIDDTPLGSSSGNLRGGLYSLDLMPYDIERIEVLRGPQGTLYGASTMGGLLKYVLRSPDLHQFEGRIGSDVQRIDGSGGAGWGVRGAVNIPLIEGKLGIRASGFHQYSAGYINNVGLGIKDENHYAQDGGRLALLWQPIEDLKIRASAQLQDIDAAGNAAVSLDEFTRQPAFGVSSRSTSLPEYYRQHLQYYSLTGDLDMGFATLTSASGWSRTQNLASQDNTGSFAGVIPQLTNGAVSGGLVPFNFALRLAKFTQEIRLTSPTGRHFQWMAGGFYTDEDALNFQQLLALNQAGAEIPGGISPMFTALRPSTYRETALFGNATYELTERFDLTGGIRYAGNKQTSTNVRSGVLSDNSTRSAKSDENVFTWMVSPRFRLNSDAMLYVRVATGYRPGGPTAGLPGTPASYVSDTLINYEAGFKGELFERRLQLDASLFYISWKDIQITATNAQGFSYAANGGTASSKGVELTTSYLVTDGLHFGGTLAYTDAHLTQDAPSLFGMTGDQLPLSPRWSGSLTVDYEHSLDDHRSFSVGGGYRYQGKVYNDFQRASDAEPVAAQKIFDLNAGLTVSQITVRLFMKNVLNERAYSTLFSPYAPNYPPQLVPVQPRTVGVSVDATFGGNQR